MRPVFLIDALRTPIGARGGGLSGWHAADLAAEVLRALADRNGFDPAEVHDVLLGCAMPVGSQGFNVARSSVLAAGWPSAVPAGTIDRQALSSLSALAAASHAVASGAAELVIAGGVEVMSTTPHGATLVPGAMPFGPAVIERYREAGGLVPAGGAAEAMAAAAGVGREALDAFALRSHQRYVPGPELLPVPARVLDRDKGEIVRPGTSVSRDELPRPAIAAEHLAALHPAFTLGGAVTAGNSAAIGDGAAAVLVASEAVASRLGRDPLARVAGVRLVGVDPIEMLTGAVPAVEAVLGAAGVGVAEVDQVEVGEPFAVVALALEQALGLDPARVNTTGGGIALGEPTGMVGARLVATLTQGLAGRWGLAATVSAGGLGGAVLLERR